MIKTKGIVFSQHLFFYLSSMTLSQFHHLPIDEQQLALKEAVLLADRELGQYSVYLFQLADFYIEVFCHKNDPSIGKFVAFCSIDGLEPCLEKISTCEKT